MRSRLHTITAIFAGFCLACAPVMLVGVCRCNATKRYSLGNSCPKCVSAHRLDASFEEGAADLAGSTCCSHCCASDVVTLPTDSPTQTSDRDSNSPSPIKPCCCSDLREGDPYFGGYAAPQVSTDCPTDGLADRQLTQRRHLIPQSTNRLHSTVVECYLPPPARILYCVWRN